MILFIGINVVMLFRIVTKQNRIIIRTINEFEFRVLEGEVERSLFDG